VHGHRRDGILRCSGSSGCRVVEMKTKDPPSLPDEPKIFHLIGLPVFVLDTEQTILMINPAAEALLKTSQELVRGKKCFELLHGSQSPPKECPLKRMLTSGQLETAEMEVEALGGTYLVSCTPVIGENDDIEKIIHICTDITEKARAEEKLKEKEHIINSATSVITTADLDGRMTYVNPAFLRMWGFDDAGEVLGRHFSEYWMVKRPDDIMHSLLKYGNWSDEIKARKKDGTLFDVQVHASTVVDKKGTPVAFMSSCNDITDRKRTEGALQFTQFAVDHYSDAAFWMGHDARFIYVNEAACRSLGYTRDELLEMAVYDIDPDFPEEAWPDHWADLKTRGSFIIQSHHKTKDGRVFPVELSVNYVKFGEKEYNCAFARDISERRRMEAEKDKLRTQLQQAKKIEAIATLAGGIAHDFNNALSVITTGIDLLRLDHSDDTDVVAQLRPMSDSAHRMADLSNQLIAYAKGGKYQAKTVSLSRFVEDEVPAFFGSDDEGIYLEINVPSDAPNVHADVSQLGMVLSSIITNAKEAIEGAGCIQVSTGSIDADQEFIDKRPGLKTGRYAFLKIEDDGKGMDKETLRKVFEPFFTTKSHGRGLGMAATYGIVKNHDGWIDIDSGLGKGTSVQIYLPALYGSGMRLSDKRK